MIQTQWRKTMLWFSYLCSKRFSQKKYILTDKKDLKKFSWKEEILPDKKDLKKFSVKEEILPDKKD